MVFHPILHRVTLDFDTPLSSNLRISSGLKIVQYLNENIEKIRELGNKILKELKEAEKMPVEIGNMCRNSFKSQSNTSAKLMGNSLDNENQSYEEAVLAEKQLAMSKIKQIEIQYHQTHSLELLYKLLVWMKIHRKDYTFWRYF